MSQAAESVGPNRYRESFGRYYDDFQVGDVYEHRPGRSITETDNIWFTLLTMNTHPAHFDNAYAAKSEFIKLVSHELAARGKVTGSRSVSRGGAG